MGKSDSSQGILVQMFIISPAISWILKPGRFPKRRAFFYAVGFLVAIAAVTIVRPAAAAAAMGELSIV